MTRTSVAGCLILPFLTCLSLAEDFVPPKTAAPMIYVIRNIDKKKQELTLVLMTAALDKTKAKENGLSPPEYPKVKLGSQEITANMLGFAVMTAEGKTLEPALDHLHEGQAILLTIDSNGVDPVYRRILSKDAVLLVALYKEKVLKALEKKKKDTRLEATP